jgi:hypothetical protein
MGVLAADYVSPWTLATLRDVVRAAPAYAICLALVYAWERVIGGDPAPDLTTLTLIGLTLLAWEVGVKAGRRAR